MTDWHWNEFQQLGTDYADIGEVAKYDARMRELRDVDAENRAICDMIALGPESTILEIGTGTGAFARYAAPCCRSVTALDVSSTMIEYARSKAAAESIANIEFRCGSFLTFAVAPASLDAVVSGLAFHHLPDVWKMVALKRIFSALKPGGRFALLDVVFTDCTDEYFAKIVASGASSRSNVARHIAQELSTFDWILEEMFTRAGFVIESKSYENDYIATYCVRKPY
ncbi:Ubiquinone/menaquinone biosynthesis C-methyltransferase UbiE [bioreactor metagenome]|uniref:Ubiquinone/menaquinone biosynthesis C-methyltransferase UbiE n=1 Tax=bioreactor metagenome TaxID=1076179 RepID=A0A645E9D8_9ZZZZ|nr:class I SAM-dependent methyltransferase [Victivallaceae bacterium]